MTASQMLSVMNKEKKRQAGKFKTMFSTCGLIQKAKGQANCRQQLWGKDDFINKMRRESQKPE